MLCFYGKYVNGPKLTTVQAVVNMGVQSLTGGWEEQPISTQLWTAADTFPIS